jgi:hypothetical protein
MKKISVLFFTLALFSTVTKGQHQNLDSLKREILSLRADVDNIQINLTTSQNKFKRGIGVATVGYAVTIAGGLILGQNEDLGKTLLVTGGVTGITGTFLMVDAFKYLSRAGKNKKRE